ncbi:serine/threonine-protein kinase [Nonomuraea diastatica]|nr:serine/threonine-protein kinase [Nonomuraea diastatica]
MASVGALCHHQGPALDLAPKHGVDAAGDYRRLDAPLDTSLLADRYRLLQPLGRGGMGTVWHGHDELLTREVAIKEVALPAGPERTIVAERTRQEARVTARISHPHVAGVYDVVEVSGQPWIVLELVRSRTLGQRVAQDGPLSPRTLAKIGLELLRGLCAAHAAGIVHLDVKPDNVLLAHDGRVVLTDFGIAVMDGDASLTQTGTLTGTMAFLAPERVTGDTCRQSDLWSLGATLFMAVEGQPPFCRDTAIHTLVAMLADPPDPSQRAGPLASVLAGLLDKNPATRLDAVGASEQLRHVADLWPLKDESAAAAVLHIPVAGDLVGRSGERTSRCGGAAHLSYHRTERDQLNESDDCHTDVVQQQRQGREMRRHDDRAPPRQPPGRTTPGQQEAPGSTGDDPCHDQDAEPGVLPLQGARLFPVRSGQHPESHSERDLQDRPGTQPDPPAPGGFSSAQPNHAVVKHWSRKNPVSISTDFRGRAGRSVRRTVGTHPAGRDSLPSFLACLVMCRCAQ